MPGGTGPALRSGSAAEGKKIANPSTAPGSSEAKERSRGWRKSLFTPADVGILRGNGFLRNAEVRFPSEEVTPIPEPGWSVVFFAFFLRGFSLPAHEFLRGLLFIYGLQLHDLSPNALLHITFFVTFCECFLGIHPHWGLWMHLYTIKNQRSEERRVGKEC